MGRYIEYRVDLNERGEYAATVYEDDEVLAEFYTEDLEFMIEHGGVKHGLDEQGIRDYLIGIEVIDLSDTFKFSA